MASVTAPATTAEVHAAPVPTVAPAAAAPTTGKGGEAEEDEDEDEAEDAGDVVAGAGKSII
jgi:hypothetical protein